MEKLFCIAASLALALSTHAASFGMTNVLNPTVNVTGFPTNSGLTGGPIGVAGYDTADFYVKGMPWPACSNSTFTFVLLSSDSKTLPTVVTNGAGLITQNDWDDLVSNNSKRMTISFGHFGPGDCTNFISWRTNLPREFWQSANYVGVYSATNASTNSGVLCALTNFEAGLNLKALSGPAPHND
jgi:hypothetical protein